jgi:RNA polymerase sigma factor (sigma-70 family)
VNDKEKEDLIRQYCDNKMKQLRKICDPIIRLMNVPLSEYDDLYSDAMNVVLESVENFNQERNCSFNTFLVGNIKRSFQDWLRDKHRWKRCNLETDERGNLKRNEQGQTISIPNVSLDMKTEDGIDLAEKIACVENNTDEELSDNAQEYLKSLSPTQREIASLIMDGYQLKDIQKMLDISDKRWNKTVADMRSFSKKNIIRKDTTIKEDKHMVLANTTQTFEKSKNTDLSIGSIIKKMNKQTIRFDHPLQRESDQWTSIMQSNLISDILQGNPIPALVFAEEIINYIPIIWDLDGKQRCTTAQKFFEDGFKISKKVRRNIITYSELLKDENGVNILDENGNLQCEIKQFDIIGKKYSDLPEELQEKFVDYSFKITKYLNCSKEDIAYHIARYNEGRAMTAQQKGIIELGEHFALSAKQISAMPLFKELSSFTTKETKNGTSDRVVVESVMLINFKDDWKKDQSAMCEYVKNNANDDMFDEVEDLVDCLESIKNDEFYELFDSKNTFLWLAAFREFKELTNYEVDDVKFADFLIEFNKTLQYKEVDGESFYDLCVDKETGKNRATKDKYIVLPKFEKLLYLMKEFLGIEDNESSASEEIAEMTTENKNIINEENIESDVHDNIQNSVQEIENNILEGIEQEDIEFYETMIEDVLPSNSELAQKAHDELVKLIDYSCEKDYDMALEKWLKTIDESVLISSDKTENYNNMKKLFIEYMLNQEKNVA